MLTFLQTERLLLRQFTPDDAELLVEPDSDPRVMRYITGGIPTSRGEIEGDFLPAFLDYYQRFPGYGFWAANFPATASGPQTRSRPGSS